MLVYAITAAPSVSPGHDSGELTTVAYCLGVAHPPGYPLFTRLAHAWGQLVGGDYGWRINLFSGACTALAAALLADLTRRATNSGPAAVVAGLGFAWLGSVWRQAVITEVFGLHFAITAALGWLGWRVVDRLEAGADWKGWLWAFYACIGLGFAHHHTFVLALPGLLAVAWPHWRKVLWTPAWLAALAVTCLFYGDLWLRAAAEPTLNWGGIRTFGELLNHFLRRTYGTFRLTNKVDSLENGVVHGVAYLLFTYARQAPLAWMLLASWGGWVGRLRQRRLWLMAWGWLIAFGPFFALIGRQKLDNFHLDMLERFYASSYLGLALLAGLGMADLGRRLGPVWPWLLATALLCWQLLGNLASCRLDGRELMASYAHQLLDNCPARCMLVVAGDLPVGAVQYVQIVEGYRQEVPVVCPGLIGSRWYRRGLPQWFWPLLQDRVKVKPLADACKAAGVPVFTNQKGDLEGPMRPRRLCWQWFPPEAVELTEVASLSSVLQDASRLRPGLGEEGRFWPLYLISTRIAWLRSLSGAVYRQHPQLALSALDLVLELGPPGNLDQLNRGLLRQRLGRHGGAIQDFQTCLERDPKMELARVALVYSQTCLALRGIKI